MIRLMQGNILHAAEGGDGYIPVALEIICPLIMCNSTIIWFTHLLTMCGEGRELNVPSFTDNILTTASYSILLTLSEQHLC